MAYDIGKPAKTLRLDIKQISRVLAQVHTDTQAALRKIAALNLNYAADQGTFPADPDAAALVTLLGTVQTFLQTNAAVITKGADFGDNIT